MISAGFGCKKGCAASDLIDALKQALATHGKTLADVSALHAPERKRDEQGLQTAAAQLGKPLRFVGQADLTAQEAKLLTHSPHSLEHTGVSCVCEAAALAGEGVGARLLGPRTMFGGATCALAVSESDV